MAVHPDTYGAWVRDPSGIFEWKSNGSPGGTEARPVRPLATEAENAAYAVAISMFDGESQAEGESRYVMFQAPTGTVKMLAADGVTQITVDVATLPPGQQDFYLGLDAQRAREATDARALIAGGELYRQGLGPAPLTPAVNLESAAPRCDRCLIPNLEPLVYFAALPPDTLLPAAIPGAVTAIGNGLQLAAVQSALGTAASSRKWWLIGAGALAVLVVGWYLTHGRGR